MPAIVFGALLLLVGASNILRTRRYERREHLPRRLWVMYHQGVMVYGPVGLWRIAMAAGALAIAGGVVYVVVT